MMAPWKPPVLRLAMTLVPRPRRGDAPTTAMLLGASSVAMASMDIPEHASSKGNLRISIYGAAHNRICLQQCQLEDGNVLPVCSFCRGRRHGLGDAAGRNGRHRNR